MPIRNSEPIYEQMDVGKRNFYIKQQLLADDDAIRVPLQTITQLFRRRNNFLALPPLHLLTEAAFAAYVSCGSDDASRGTCVAPPASAAAGGSLAGDR
jgi:hypothetical protein